MLNRQNIKGKEDRENMVISSPPFQGGACFGLDSQVKK
ncbi:hypothetical protein M595_0900 [Lyngbya aestuarii BL J]|uniref:Uncharacterized protein n=1 Tax=Lyngbya aestuarii BL J TaxID=1348334 RepID=U7QPY7_9CYAN|nr:hypothetical protein M595_0900 [Lyngbya aestuarii BL J]